MNHELAAIQRTSWRAWAAPATTEELIIVLDIRQIQVFDFNLLIRCSKDPLIPSNGVKDVEEHFSCGGGPFVRPLPAGKFLVGFAAPRFPSRTLAAAPTARVAFSSRHQAADRDLAICHTV